MNMNRILITLTALFSALLGTPAEGITWTNADNVSGRLTSILPLLGYPRGKAVLFGGTDSVLDLNPVTLDFSKGFSALLWLKVPPDHLNQRTILSFGTPGAKDALQLLLTRLGFVRVAYGGLTPQGCGQVDDDRWHFVSLTFDGKDLCVCLDHLLEVPAYVFSDLTNDIQQVSAQLGKATGPMRIGAQPDGSLPLRGALGEIALFDHVLEWDEIEAFRKGTDPAEVDLSRATPDIDWRTAETAERYARAHAYEPPPGLVFSLRQVLAGSPFPRIPFDPLITDPIWGSCKDGNLLFNQRNGLWYYYFCLLYTSDAADE